MTDAAIVELLTEVRDSSRENGLCLSRIADALDRLARVAKRQVPQADRELLARLLPAIFGVMRDRPFVIRDLAARTPTSNVKPAIALRAALGATDPKRLGYVFRRCVGCEVNGYTIVTRTKGSSGRRWAIQCDDSSSRIITAFASGLGAGSNRDHG